MMLFARDRARNFASKANRSRESSVRPILNSISVNKSTCLIMYFRHCERCFNIENYIFHLRFNLSDKSIKFFSDFIFEISSSN